MIVLASASPRRKQLLDTLFDDFKIICSDVNEVSAYTKPYLIAMDLACQKAKAVADKCDSQSVVIGADTIVVYKNKVFNKPVDKNQAFEFLKILAGKNHNVYTGVCVINKGSGKICKGYCKTQVRLKDMTDLQISDYIATGSPMDKAGAYGIQDGVVDKICGEYDNVVGLPCKTLMKLIGESYGNNRAGY